MSTEADWRLAGFSVGDRLFEREEAVVHVMGWVGRPRRRGRFVDDGLFGSRTTVQRLGGWGGGPGGAAVTRSAGYAFPQPLTRVTIVI